MMAMASDFGGALWQDFMPQPMPHMAVPDYIIEDAGPGPSCPPPTRHQPARRVARARAGQRPASQQPQPPMLPQQPTPEPEYHYQPVRPHAHRPSGQQHSREGPMTAEEFLQIAGELQATAHDLWKEEEIELQRGAELMVISCSSVPPSTAHAQLHEQYAQLNAPSTPMFDFGASLLQAGLPSLNSPVSGGEYSASLAAAFGLNPGLELEMMPGSSGGNMHSCPPIMQQHQQHHCHHHQHQQPMHHCHHQQQMQQHQHQQHQQQPCMMWANNMMPPQQHHNPHMMGIHHDAEAYIAFPSHMGNPHMGMQQGPAKVKPQHMAPVPEPNYLDSFLQDGSGMHPNMPWPFMV